MKHSVRLLLALLLLYTPALLQAQSESGGSNPNIILILADDLGRGDLGSYGQQIIRTPHLDRMAAEGMRFTDFYSGSTVCAPSRESLMTGMHTGHTYLRGNFNTPFEGDFPVSFDKKTIAEYLKMSGYKTAMIGKWGLGYAGSGSGPNDQGFDYSLAYLSQMNAHSYYPPHLWENEQKLSLEGNRDDRQGAYSHDVFVDKTLEYIGNSNPERPFFLYLPYTIPHGRFEIPDDAPYSNEDWSQQKRNIAAMITLLDRDVGRIIALLKDKGIAEHTVVFFTSDNGPGGAATRFFDSNGALRGIKRDLYEGGIRAPLIAWWPGTIKAGQTSAHIAAAWDLLPTLAGIAGVEVSPDIDGLSFLPELLGNQQPVHDFLYWEYYAYNWNWDEPGNGRPRNWLEARAVRYGRWKAVQTGLFDNPEAPLELYDLATDPGEARNVAAAHPGVVRKIRAYLSGCCSTSPYFPYQQ